MFSYEYINNYRPITVTFYGEWKRYHYCKAAYMHVKTYSTDDRYVYEKWLFVSYATPILVIERMYLMGTGGIKGYNIMWNEDSYRCSATTIHQLSRFLNELDLRYGIGIGYYDLKQYENTPIDNPIKRHGNIYYLHPLSYVEIKEYVTIECAKDSPYFAQ